MREHVAQAEQARDEAKQALVDQLALLRQSQQQREELLLKAMKEGKRILFEGAHAVLLDVDHGTYPYVTSSNCSALGLFTGAGIPPQAVQNYVGIIKAYSTRVGGGPFPSEQNNDIGNYIREHGNEYGTTTRRPRRCGWFDAVAVRYSVELCGVTHVAMTLLDVLSGLDRVQICVGHKYRGKQLEYFRADMDMLAEVEPIYETMPGWHGDIQGCRRFEELPKEAQQYVQRVEQLIALGAKEGASVPVDGRGTVVKGYERGSFVRPTILSDVPIGSEIARTEIFGPVLSLMHVNSIDEAIQLVNSGQYGNQASLFTISGNAARRFRYEVDAGNIGINIGVAAPMAFFPFSGWKDSFFGDMHGQGMDAVEFFTQKKVVVERWPKEWTRKF